MPSVLESGIRARCPQYLVNLVEAMEGTTPFVHALHGFDDLPQMTTRTLIGILVAVTGNILISLALNLQKLAHKRVENRKRVFNQKQRRKLKTSFMQLLNFRLQMEQLLMKETKMKTMKGTKKWKTYFQPVQRRQMQSYNHSPHTQSPR